MEVHGLLYNVPRKLRLERTEQLLRVFELWDRKDTLGEAVLGRDEAPARDCPRVSAHAEDPLSRRADARPRPAEPQPAVDACAHLNETEHVTVFLTTHYMDEADRVAHRIAVIDHGAIVAQGTVAGAEAADRHGIARGRVPGADGLVDPRRDGFVRRPDAAGRHDVEARR